MGTSQSTTSATSAATPTSVSAISNATATDALADVFAHAATSDATATATHDADAAISTATAHANANAAAEFLATAVDANSTNARELAPANAYAAHSAHDPAIRLTADSGRYTAKHGQQAMGINDADCSTAAPISLVATVRSAHDRDSR